MCGRHSIIIVRRKGQELLYFWINHVNFVNYSRNRVYKPRGGLLAIYTKGITQWMSWLLRSDIFTIIIIHSLQKALHDNKAAFLSNFKLNGGFLHFRAFWLKAEVCKILIPTLSERYKTLNWIGFLFRKTTIESLFSQELERQNGCH